MQTVTIAESIYKNLLASSKELVGAASLLDRDCRCEDGPSIAAEINACQEAIDTAELRGPLVVL